MVDGGLVLVVLVCPRRSRCLFLPSTQAAVGEAGAGRGSHGVFQLPVTISFSEKLRKTGYELKRYVGSAFFLIGVQPAANFVILF